MRGVAIGEDGEPMIGANIGREGGRRATGTALLLSGCPGLLGPIVGPTRRKSDNEK